MIKMPLPTNLHIRHAMVVRRIIVFDFPLWVLFFFKSIKINMQEHLAKDWDWYKGRFTIMIQSFVIQNEREREQLDSYKIML